MREKKKCKKTKPTCRIRKGGKRAGQIGFVFFRKYG